MRVHPEAAVRLCPSIGRVRGGDNQGLPNRVIISIILNGGRSKHPGNNKICRKFTVLVNIDQINPADSVGWPG